MEAIVEFVSLLALLFFAPKILYRFSLPEQLTEIFLGILLGPFFLHLFEKDQLIQVLGTIGIITLFFMAGFDVDILGIKRKQKTLLEHGVLHILLLLLLAVTFIFITDFSFIQSALIAIALLTPSAGFVIAATRAMNLQNTVVEWVEIKVVSAEILSLLILLLLLKMQTPFLLIVIIVLLWAAAKMLPLVLEYAYRYILGAVHRSDTFLIFVLLTLFAWGTHAAGIHYIIGAFIVGLVVNAFQKEEQKIKINHEKITMTFSSFSSIFVPFYFFSVGVGITRDMFTGKNILLAVLLFSLIICIKILVSFFHRRFTLRESLKSSVIISFLTAPTVLFTFVLADILLSEYNIPLGWYGVLILYGLFSAIIPLFVVALENYIKKNRQ